MLRLQLEMTTYVSHIRHEWQESGGHSNVDITTCITATVTVDSTPAEKRSALTHWFDSATILCSCQQHQIPI